MIWTVILQVPAEVSRNATPAGPSGGDGDGDGEDEDDALDEVQQAAMDEYLKQKQEKLERKADSEDSRKRKPTQAMAHMGRKTTTSKPSKDTDEKGSSTTESDKPQTKRKKTAKAVNNRSLLSFSMDDDA
ncbi:TPA: hypothetical protein N0F65_005588 [Lagenidium giganteum]|uniref:DUF4604 domain-containing protein n=1 Tax=Lagenidium giganteum TaxID=4803 RepID=A0AAV2Z7U1_9STRA|nr:TPA: hypothetical protein N0F65_005588 [Lagenidium giganteum]